MESKIWSLIKMKPEIWEHLWVLYPEEKVYVKNVEILSNTEYKIQCVFPPSKDNKWRKDIVDITQKQAAITQSLYISFGLYVKNNPEKIPFPAEKYRDARKDAVYARDSKYFWDENKIIPGKETYTIIEVSKIRKGYTITEKEPFYAVFFNMKGDPNSDNILVNGKVTCALMEKYVK